MSRKINTNLEKPFSKVTKKSIFNRLINEISLVEIPAKYVDTVLVQYMDGAVVELNGTEITEPIQMTGYAPQVNTQNVFKQTKDIRVLINIELLEQDINAMIERMLKDLC